jgi:hypothetical protein
VSSSKEELHLITIKLIVVAQTDFIQVIEVRKGLPQLKAATKTLESQYTIKGMRLQSLLLHCYSSSIKFSGFVFSTI